MRLFLYRHSMSTTPLLIAPIIVKFKHLHCHNRLNRYPSPTVNPSFKLRQISYIITAIMFTAFGFHYAGNVDMSKIDSVIKAMEVQFYITPYSFVPVLTVLGLLAFNMPSFPVISFGSLLGIIWAVMIQEIDFLTAFNSYRKLTWLI